MANVAEGRPGTTSLLLGNEAIARGALEAGLQVCAGYPGTPSTEIVQTIIDSTQGTNVYVEWSTNEKVAVEVAAAAAFAGLTSIAVMKNAGASVGMDAFMHLNLSGLGEGGGAMVVVICDDPQAHSSGDEMDTRSIAQMADVPLLEPSSSQEAKDIVKWAFELSRQFKVYCVVRGYTRLAHSRNRVLFGDLPSVSKTAFVDTTKLLTPYATAFGKEYPPQRHAWLHEKQALVKEIFESSPFNSYSGPDRPELLIVTSGSGWPCTLDALDALDMTESVGVIKLATLWPLPTRFLERHIAKTTRVLVVEEVDPFVETQIRAMMSESDVIKGVKVYGRLSGHLNGHGEVTPDLVIRAVSSVLGRDYESREATYEEAAREADALVIDRGLAWCAGCPHRATFYVLKNLARRFGIRPVVLGDIGCYTMDQWACGTHQTNACLCMGSATGLASGFGQLARFGLEQPVIAVAGDSTFFHASIPALVNAAFNGSKMCLIVLDNSATAMTGFQPHPGTGRVAMGAESPRIEIEQVAAACGVPFVRVIDPFEVKSALDTLEEALRSDGLAVVISRRKCALITAREKGAKGEKSVPYRVDQDKCIKSVLAAKEKVMPCAAACPAGNDIPLFINLVKRQRYSQAREAITKGNPIPASLARICHHPCETHCASGTFEEPIAIHNIERFLGDYGESQPSNTKPDAKKPEKVAVIGSGPAGLTCAYNLTLMGYRTTVFEALPVAGGMLAVGVPSYRLPKEVLLSEIHTIEEMGVRIELNSPVGSPGDLLQEGYKAVFVATGAHRDLTLGVSGEDKEGVLTACAFLRSVNLAMPLPVGRQVLVFGGGNAAIDSARVAVRGGAEAVSVVYRRSRSEMTASQEEIRAAEDEGIQFLFLAAPMRILGDGTVSGAECVRMELGEPDASGRPRPLPVDGSEFVITADTVIEAVGQVAEIPFAGSGLPVSSDGRLEVDTATLLTARPGIFAGGDAVTGPSYAALAVGAGKRAAASIDRYLRGEQLGEEKRRPAVVSYEELVLEGMPRLPRAEGPTLDIATRVRGFGEVEATLTPALAVGEAERCLSCNPLSERCIVSLNCPAMMRDANGRTRIVRSMCNGCGLCAAVCPHNAIVKEALP